MTLLELLRQELPKRGGWPEGANFIEWKSGTHKGGDIIRGDFPLERVRPLRTEAERAIDEMVQLSGVSIGAAKILYDAGYRK